MITKLEQILEFNREGKTRKEIKELLGYKNLDNLTRLMKKNNYIYDVDSDTYIEKEKVEDAISTLVSPSTTKVLQENLVALSSNYSEIAEVLTWFKAFKTQENTIVSATIVDGLQIVNGAFKEATRTSIKIDKEVWNEFDKFCKEHKQFKKQDLHSKALEEFITKYKE
ncbi:MAG: hypothetical protein RR929_01045 [Erysipelotrichaceae bacterium]